MYNSPNKVTGDHHHFYPDLVQPDPVTDSQHLPASEPAVSSDPGQDVSAPDQPGSHQGLQPQAAQQSVSDPGLENTVSTEHS